MYLKYLWNKIHEIRLEMLHFTVVQRLIKTLSVLWVLISLCTTVHFKTDKTIKFLSTYTKFTWAFSWILTKNHVKYSFLRELIESDPPEIFWWVGFYLLVEMKHRALKSESKLYFHFLGGPPPTGMGNMGPTGGYVAK